MIVNELDLHYGALIACILNNNLSPELSLKKMNIPIKIPKMAGSGNKKTQKKILENIQSIKEMYLIENLSTIKIGKIYGIAPKTVGKCLSECGIKLRARGAIKNNKIKKAR